MIIAAIVVALIAASGSKDSVLTAAGWAMGGGAIAVVALLLLYWVMAPSQMYREDADQYYAELQDANDKLAAKEQQLADQDQKRHELQQKFAKSRRRKLAETEKQSKGALRGLFGSTPAIDRFSGELGELIKRGEWIRNQVKRSKLWGWDNQIERFLTYAVGEEAVEGFHACTREIGNVEKYDAQFTKYVNAQLDHLKELRTATKPEALDPAF